MSVCEFIKFRVKEIFVEGTTATSECLPFHDAMSAITPHQKHFLRLNEKDDGREWDDVLTATRKLKLILKLKNYINYCHVQSSLKVLWIIEGISFGSSRQLQDCVCRIDELSTSAVASKKATVWWSESFLNFALNLNSFQALSSHWLLNSR